MKCIATLLLQLALPFYMLAQYDYLDVPIIKNNQTSPVGLAGGLNTPQFSAVDLNNDGIKDLLVYDRSSHIALTFLNNGTSNQVDYEYAPSYQSRFPQNSEKYMLLRDYNGDGIEDLFYFERSAAAPSGGVALLEGSYDASNKIQFTTVDSALLFVDTQGSTNPISIFAPDIPAITDIDNDGDLDILAFSTDLFFSRNIYWYKNTSVEQGNGLNNPTFKLQHECWGMVTETNIANTVYLSPSTDSCPDNTFWTPSMPAGPRHAGSTLAAIDYNGDGVKDIVMGDASINTLNLMTNSVVNDTFLITQQDSVYPSYNVSADILTFPAAFFLDVNNDGITDMIGSPNEPGFGVAVTDSVAWFYQNTQSNTNIQLDFQQKDFLVGDMIDLGRNAYPVFFDYNADGLLDLLIGHYGAFQQNSTYKTGLTLLENTGTVAAPQFTFITNNYANLDSLNVIGMHPTVGDIDKDGDEDLLLGNSDGTLIFLENKAGANQPASWATPIRNYQSIDVDDFSSPQLVDLDKDGDLDLAIGEKKGNINYFENTSIASTPVFSTTPTTIGLSGFDMNVLNPASSYSNPCFFEVSGTFELFIGHENGFPFHFNNINNNILGVYDTVSLGISSLWTGRYTDLDAADINNDGRMDLVIGNNRGGISFFSVDTQTVNTTAIPSHLQSNIERIYPNPTKDYLYVDLKAPNNSPLTFSIHNSLGQLVEQQVHSSYEKQHQINLKHLPSGIYFLQTNTPTIENWKFIIR